MSNVNHPKHYNKGKIEVIDFIEDQDLNFHRGNAVKYICRAGDKEPGIKKELEDIDKAIWYLQREKQRIRQTELDLLTKPGDTISETLDSLKMSVMEFAHKCGYSVIFVKAIIAGREPITTEIAERLCDVLKIDTAFWIGRERLYRDKLSELA